MSAKIKPTHDTFSVTPSELAGERCAAVTLGQSAAMFMSGTASPVYDRDGNGLHPVLILDAESAAGLVEELAHAFGFNYEDPSSWDEERREELEGGHDDT